MCRAFCGCPLTVGEKAERLWLRQMQVSKHLRVLSDSGLVEVASKVTAKWRNARLHHTSLRRIIECRETVIRKDLLKRGIQNRILEKSQCHLKSKSLILLMLHENLWLRHSPNHNICGTGGGQKVGLSCSESRFPPGRCLSLQPKTF
ncbi:hypothetical protein [Paenibacillus lautus]|uniref:hypothetical protein n=1 Tax=Paenibacillus lautus TaxID=1401 RepID=UPI00398AA7B0